MEERNLHLSKEEVEELSKLTSPSSIREHSGRISKTLDEWTDFLSRALYGPSEDLVLNYGSVSAAIRATLSDTGEDFVQARNFEQALNNVIHECRLFERQDVSQSPQLDRALELIQEFRPPSGYEKVLSLLRNPTAILKADREAYLIQFISILFSYLPSSPRDQVDSRSFEYLTEHFCLIVKSDQPKNARSFAAAALIASGVLDGTGQVRFTTRDPELLLRYLDVEGVHEALRDLLYGSDLKRSQGVLNRMIRHWRAIESAATKMGAKESIAGWLRLSGGTDKN